jgi:hypothetical protein
VYDKWRTLPGHTGQREHGGDAVGADGVGGDLHAGHVLHGERHLPVGAQDLCEGCAGGLQDVLRANIDLTKI